MMGNATPATPATPVVFDVSNIHRAQLALAPLAIWFRMPSSIAGLDVTAEQYWWLYSKRQLPRQETLPELLGLTTGDLLALRAGHGRLDEQELLPDYCIGCTTHRAPLQGGRLRYACPSCPPYARSMEARVCRHQRLSMMAICAGYDSSTMEWLYLHFIAKSWMFSSTQEPERTERTERTAHPDWEVLTNDPRN